MAVVEGGAAKSALGTTVTENVSVVVGMAREHVAIEVPFAPATSGTAEQLAMLVVPRRKSAFPTGETSDPALVFVTVAVISMFAALAGSGPTAALSEVDAGAMVTEAGNDVLPSYAPPAYAYDASKVYGVPETASTGSMHVAVPLLTATFWQMGDPDAPGMGWTVEDPVPAMTSSKATVPPDTGAPDEVTDALSVMGVPKEMDEEPGVRVSDVEVGSPLTLK